MKIERKPNSQIRAEKEKMVMENFASVMKKLDATFLIESEDEAFSSYLTNTEVLTPSEDDDAGDFSGGKILTYKIPKNSRFSLNNEDEMYDMLIDMFGKGDYNGLGRRYTKINYDIKDGGNYWYIKISEIEGYDI